jgi:hypothetical protein
MSSVFTTFGFLLFDSAYSTLPIGQLSLDRLHHLVVHAQQFLGLIAELPVLFELLNGNNSVGSNKYKVTIKKVIGFKFKKRTAVDSVWV